MTEPIYCIRCDAELEPTQPGRTQASTAPSGGMVLYAHGNYGSAVFDPMDGGATRLELYLCDGCAVLKAASIWHVTGRESRPDNEYLRFDRVRVLPTPTEWPPKATVGAPPPALLTPNQTVTDAIFAAESALHGAIAAWKRVYDGESTVALKSQDRIQRDIAHGDVGRADLVIDILYTLLGRCREREL